MSAEHYLTELQRIGPILPGQGLPWLAGLRGRALAAFSADGFPTRHDEEWKYTSVAPIENGHFSLQPLPSLKPLQTFAASAVDAARIQALALPTARLLVFIDGRYAPALSMADELPAGLTVASLAALLEREPERLQIWLEPKAAALDVSSGAPASAFAALNTACMADGAYLHLAPGTVLEAPLQLLFVASTADLASHCRNLVIAEAGSRACIVEHHASLGAASYFTNVVTDIHLGSGARIEHHKLQEESLEACHIAAVHAELAEGSRFLSTSFALGGALVRTDIAVRLAAEGAECVLDGLYLADGRQHIDHHTRIDHLRPRGSSREFYKGVVAGAARAVFDGKVIVHVDAQQSDAAQSNRNLLLSAQAEVDTKPQLEIWADDVKCSHGATVGQLDAEQIFYLRSRGIAADVARALLTHAFAAEMIDRIELATLRRRLQGLLQQRLPQTKELLS